MSMKNVALGLAGFVAAMSAITAVQAQPTRQATAKSDQADPIGDLIDSLDKQDAQARKVSKGNRYTSIKVNNCDVPVRKAMLEGAPISAADSKAFGNAMKACDAKRSRPKVSRAKGPQAG